MRTQKWLLLAVVLVVTLALALPGSAVIARKQVFRASLSTANELHQVVDSTARGSSVVVSNMDGSFSFTVIVRRLSGPATGVHLHAPADATQTAPIFISLCGAPSPSVVGDCTYDADGNLYITGEIGPAQLMAAGVTGAQFNNYLRSGLIYVNVHTALNPMGEARGQLLEP
ncbi:MAG: CHRD domain-containing protein [Chloroflexota bacterium]|nr:MAG: CHRD domain-containing protein [Bellilinea sp.]